ncbi:MAG: MBL fold metallo-hydrolase [Actinomycetota bacterium]|nr:MBL fold metallo-hydrolase [Actinomycetota bacterium]
MAVTDTAEAPGIRVRIIETPTLGDRSYLVTDGQVALVIDPQRDIDRLVACAAEEGVRITHVAETHLHNDYASGGLVLARSVGASYLMARGDTVAFDRTPIVDNEEIVVGRMTVTAMATPGHTVHHLAYAVSVGGRCVGVFTGGSMLYGATGRSDLVSPELAEDLTRDQYRSVRRLADVLDPATPVYPTHGFGSFCAASDAPVVDASTIGDETAKNPALRIDKEDAFVKETLAGLSPYPRYYAHMNYLNQAGALPVDLSSLPPADSTTVAMRVGVGEWVVDLRSRQAFADGHLAGTVNIAVDEDSFASYLGWVVPWGSRLTLITDQPSQVADAQRELARIGIDRPGAAFVGSIKMLVWPWEPRLFPITDFVGVAATSTQDSVKILDVRHGHEWRSGHIRQRLPRADATTQHTSLWNHHLPA